MSKNLRNLKKHWKAANANKGKGGGFDEYEDGRYMTTITDADLGESKSGSREQIMIEYTFQEGTYANKTKRDYIGLDSEMGCQIAVNTLTKLGIEVEDPSQLEGKLKEIIGKVCRIQLKTKGEYQNIYILKVMGVATSEEASNGAGSSDEAVAEPDVEAPTPDPEPEPEAISETEEPQPEAIPEEVELKVGSKVAFNLKKKEVIGKVKSIDEKAGKCTVVYEKMGYIVKGENVTIVG